MLIMLAVGINSKDHNIIIAWPQSKILFHSQVCLSRIKTVQYKEVIHEAQNPGGAAQWSNKLSEG